MSFTIQAEWIKIKQNKKGRIIIDVLPEYQDITRAYLKKVNDKNKSGKIILPLIMNPDISKRNLDQNACMHKWYDIEAKCLNAGMGGSGKHEITGWQRYEDDLKEYCPKEEILIKREFLNMYKRKFRHIHILQEDEDYVRIQIWKTSSHFTVREMAYWITRIVNRVADYGVPVDIQTYTKGEWIDLQKWIAKNKLILHSEEPCTKDEYKSKTPVCEASGEYIGNGGEVAHIVAVGMGGHEEPKKDNPANWLHLKTEIHRSLIHGKGWKAFLKLYPWLEYKYNFAMKLEEENNQSRQVLNE